MLFLIKEKRPLTEALGATPAGKLVVLTEIASADHARAQD